MTTEEVLAALEAQHVANIAAGAADPDDVTVNEIKAAIAQSSTFPMTTLASTEATAKLAQEAADLEATLNLTPQTIELELPDLTEEDETMLIAHLGADRAAAHIAKYRARVKTTTQAMWHTGSYIGSYQLQWIVAGLSTCVGSSVYVQTSCNGGNWCVEYCIRVQVNSLVLINNGWSNMGTLYFFLRQPDITTVDQWQAAYSSTSSTFQSNLFWPYGAGNTAAGSFWYNSDPNNTPGWVMEPNIICDNSLFAYGYCSGSYWSNLCTILDYSQALSTCASNSNCALMAFCVNNGGCGLGSAVGTTVSYLGAESWSNSPSYCTANTAWYNYNKVEHYNWMPLASTFQWASCALGWPMCGSGLI